jgi:cytochrome c oxidase subunit 2
MSMPPRSRTGYGPLVAVLISVVSIAAVVIALAAAGITPQQAWDSFFPVGGETPATDRGQDVRTLYNIVFFIAVAIFVLVEGLIVFTVFRYRRRPGDDALPPQTHGNNLVEILWTAIPTLIVAFLFVMSWQTLNKVDATVPVDVHVRAVAARFQWQFDYLDANGNTLFSQPVPVGDQGGLTLPVGEPVQVTLRAVDVIHAFYVPVFLFKRDAIPGRENTFDFTVDEPGTYRGQCAELCGPYHGSMIFDVHAIPRPDFDTWFAAQLAKAQATPTPAPSGPTAGPVIELSAKNIAFDTSSLQATADTPFTIHFKNEDNTVPHDVAINDAGGKQVFKGAPITGPAETNYSVPALKAGTYTFVCTIHSNMTGTLTVQ